MDFYKRRGPRAPALPRSVRPIWCLVTIAAIAVTTGLGIEAADHGRAGDRKADGPIAKSVAGPKLTAPAVETHGAPGPYDGLPSPSQARTKRNTRQQASVLSTPPQAADPPQAKRTTQPVAHLAESAGYYQPTLEQTPAATAPSQSQEAPQLQAQPQPAQSRSAQPQTSQAQPAQPQLRLPFQMPPMRFEELPPPPGTVRIPLAGPELADRVQIKQADGRLTVIVRDVPLNQVLMMLGEEQNLNMVVADNVNAPV
jgi:hypothetical protein